MEEQERERLEEMLAAITLAGNADQVREEIGELQRLAAQAQAVEAAGAEAKLSRLKRCCRRRVFRPSRAAPAPLHRVQGHT